MAPGCAECPLLQGLEHVALDSNTLCCSCRGIGSVAAQQTSSSLCRDVPASSVPEYIRILQERLEVLDFIPGLNFVSPALRMAHSRASVWPKSNDRKHLLT